VARVTFSDFDSALVPKVLNLGAGPKIFQISESDSCSDSSYHRSNRNLPMLFLKKRPRRLLLLPKLKSDFGSRFSQILDSGSERKTQNPAGVDSGTADPWPPLSHTTACICGMCNVSCFVINWLFRRIDHNGSHKPVSVLSPQYLYMQQPHHK